VSNTWTSTTELTTSVVKHLALAISNETSSGRTQPGVILPATPWILESRWRRLAGVFLRCRGKYRDCERGWGFVNFRCSATLVNEADVAIWDVTSRSSWIDLAGRAVTSVELHYEPWDESGALWCDWISIGIGERNVEFLLGDASSRDPEIKPSANNIAVVFDAHRLPVWLTDRKR
jgi:hypothetical protein